MNPTPPKLKDLLEFPCPFTFKVLGYAKPDLVDEVVVVVQQHAPGDYCPRVKLSGSGKYHSISVTIRATSIEQVEILYKDLAALPSVRMVL